MEELLKMVLGVPTMLYRTVKSSTVSLLRYWTIFLFSIPPYFITSNKQPPLHHKHSSAARVRREGNVFCISFVLVGRGSSTTDVFWYAWGAGETLALSRQSSLSLLAETHVSWQASLRQLTHQLKIHPALWHESSKWGIEMSKVHRLLPAHVG